LAAIGEQFLDEVCEGDDICGLSVSPREKDDLIQVKKALIKWLKHWSHDQEVFDSKFKLKNPFHALSI